MDKAVIRPIEWYSVYIFMSGDQAGYGRVRVSTTASTGEENTWTYNPVRFEADLPTTNAQELTSMIKDAVIAAWEQLFEPF